ncbi:hypothetical protein FB451DRAFT_1466577 [Mycena latifolia]|nr:hypothetical protein FB451DRAFT_1466577 [Mycena latifolia]
MRRFLSKSHGHNRTAYSDTPSVNPFPSCPPTPNLRTPHISLRDAPCNNQTSQGPVGPPYARLRTVLESKSAADIQFYLNEWSPLTRAPPRCSPITALPTRLPFAPSYYPAIRRPEGRRMRIHPHRPHADHLLGTTHGARTQSRGQDGGRGTPNAASLPTHLSAVRTHLASTIIVCAGLELAQSWVPPKGTHSLPSTGWRPAQLRMAQAPPRPVRPSVPHSTHPPLRPSTPIPGTSTRLRPPADLAPPAPLRRPRTPSLYSFFAVPRVRINTTYVPPCASTHRSSKPAGSRELASPASVAQAPTEMTFGAGGAAHHPPRGGLRSSWPNLLSSAPARLRM